MAKVKLLVGRVGESFNQSPGDIIEVSTGEAERLIETQQAEEVKPTPKRKVSKNTDDAAK